MPEYNLAGLSNRSFEKLIQAFAGEVLGQGAVTFGDGPDGGREATFEGRMDYPSKADAWDGYCVIQAKFLQKPKATGPDGKWALQQLEKELKDFADPKKNRRKPDYYIFATNVVLSGVAEKGGKDRAAKVFEKYAEKVPLRGWRIWDQDEIVRFLDTYEGIRRTYGAWITPGDVLAQMMEALEELIPRKSGFLQVMTNYLAKELRSDQSANLEQAGHSQEERIPLARVFVDLPITTERVAEPPTEDGQKKPPVMELVALLVDKARDPLDPESDLSQTVRRPETPHRPQPGRFVLVGGPGQGKTTVGQFACQLFRAALLRDRPQQQLAPEVRDSLRVIEEQCEPGHLRLPEARRFPVRITLSELAAALNEDETLTLLAYIAKKIALRSGREVSTEDLRRWLGAYPWLLVLDGLDEVPATTNREDVLKRVEEFWIDAAQLNADVLVLATTRPQGYNDDFSPAYYRHLWLAPLSTKRALAYAERLVGVRYAGEEGRKKKILKRLEEASKEEATARLMRSPLQVTIMGTLVDRIGRPPQDRWRLFHDYYGVIYARERERPIRAAELLREYQGDIDAIHHQVGFLLQVESERAGGTDAKLSTSRFAAVVTAHLETEGFSGSQLAVLRERIIEAAANRLVFLVGLEINQVGFEIRSLQEYMAAEALMTGDQVHVQERLRRFAPISSWRNVYLFAAGRCFARERHLRDTIHTICDELNDQLSGPVGRATLAGSVLSLELLEEGIARSQPKYSRLLAQSTVRLLELPPSEIHRRMTDVCEGEVEEIFREKIGRMLEEENPGKSAVWTLLIAMVGRGLPWAEEAADRAWSACGKEGRVKILRMEPSINEDNQWLASHFASTTEANRPDALFGLAGFGTISHPLLRLASGIGFADHSLSIKCTAADCIFPLISIDVSKDLTTQISFDSDQLHRGWLAGVEALRFLRKPSKNRLATALKSVAQDDDAFECRALFSSISWVFGSCLKFADSRDELLTLAGCARSGELGDLPDWLAAENRWKTQGVLIEDLLYGSTSPLPFDHDIAKRGFPAGIEGSSSDLFGEPKTKKRDSNYLKNIARLVSLKRVRIISAIALVRVAQLALADSSEPDWLSAINEDIYLWCDIDDASFETLVELLADNTDNPNLVYITSKLICDIATQTSLALNPFMSTQKLDLSGLPPIRYSHYTEDWARLAAIKIELLQKDCYLERAVELAVATSQLFNRRMASKTHLSSFIDALDAYERFDEATDNYLLELGQSLPITAWDLRRRIAKRLNDSLSRRESGVTDSEVWEELSFPKSLLRISTG